MPARKYKSVIRAPLNHMRELERLAQKVVERELHLIVPFMYVRFPLIGQLHRRAQIRAVEQFHANHYSTHGLTGIRDLIMISVSNRNPPQRQSSHCRSVP